MLEVVWEMAFLPDGRLLVTERAGRVRLVTPDGELQDEPWAAPDNVFHSGGGGVMGFALHPRFPEEPWVYVMYTLDTPDGEVPDDNPWPGNPVWAYGLRNAQGLAFHAGTGTLFVADHGPQARDQIHIVEGGRNYGWPRVLGAAGMDDYEDPLLEWIPAAPPGDLTFYNPAEGVGGVRSSRRPLLQHPSLPGADPHPVPGPGPTPAA